MRPIKTSPLPVLAEGSIGALLTAAELAKQLKVKPAYIRRLRHRHGLPWLPVGGEPRFDPAAVRAWLGARAKKGVKP
ncbi:MAG: hypothetical protein JWN94_2626 [Betaproteobacteria bacterium]|nr:hypothetical protein [Betaproteobacteria bacterium]